MTLELDERGMFWLPEDVIRSRAYAPDNAVPGTLKIDQDGRITLELDNLLRGRKGAVLGPLQGERAIVGILKESGSYIRLGHAQEKGLHLKSQSPSYQEFVALSCVVSSALISKPDTDEYCTGVQISLEGFEPWLGLKNAKITKGRSGVTARYHQPKTHTFNLSQATLTIRTDLTSPGGDHKASVVLDQRGILIYLPRLPMTLVGVKEFAGLIEDLLILLTDCERGLDRPRIKIKGQKGWHAVYFTHRPRSKDEISALGCWATFPQLAPIFGEIFAAWFAKHDEFGPGFHLYLGTRRGSPLFIEHRFVNLVWGLEALHRNIGAAAGSTRLDAKIKRILDAIPRKKDRDWLETQLMRVAEPSLATRLLETFRLLPIDLNADELKAFATTCADKRNEVSHYGGQKKGSTYREWVLGVHALSGALDPIYHARILQAIGLPDEQLRRVFTDSFVSFGIRQALQAVGLNLAPATSIPPVPPS